MPSFSFSSFACIYDVCDSIHLNICYFTFVRTNFNCFFFHSSTSYIYGWLPITRTLAHSNQSRFPLDFLLTFTVILPLVTRTLDNSNLPLTRSNFFPFRSFLHNFTLDNSNHAISAWKVGKKPCTEVRNIEFISKQPSQFFVFTFSHSSSNSVFIPYFVA